MIKLKCGSICHPKRGKAPEPIEGYEHSKTNPFVHVPILYPCQERNFEEPDCKGCGQNAIRMSCNERPETKAYKNRKLRIITRLECFECPKNTLKKSTMDEPAQHLDATDAKETPKDDTEKKTSYSTTTLESSTD
jgi:hypothetical protein